MRRELKKRGIQNCKVVFSNEKAIEPQSLSMEELQLTNKRSIPGSSAFVPAAFGLLIASEAVQEILRFTS